MTKKAAHGIRSTEDASAASVFRWFKSHRARFCEDPTRLLHNRQPHRKHCRARLGIRHRNLANVAIGKRLDDIEPQPGSLAFKPANPLLEYGGVFLSSRTPDPKNPLGPIKQGLEELPIGLHTPKSPTTARLRPRSSPLHNRDSDRSSRTRSAWRSSGPQVRASRSRDRTRGTRYRARTPVLAGKSQILVTTLHRSGRQRAKPGSNSRCCH